MPMTRCFRPTLPLPEHDRLWRAASGRAKTIRVDRELLCSLLVDYSTALGMLQDLGVKLEENP